MNQREEASSFIDSLRGMQAEFAQLEELREMQEIYSQDLSDMVKILQAQLDAPIPVPAGVLDRPYRSAYLGAEAVLVVFGSDGAMSTRPLQAFPPNVIVSVVQACAPELQKRLSEKRKLEGAKAKAMEKVLKELQRAQIGLGEAQKGAEDNSEDGL